MAVVVVVVRINSFTMMAARTTAEERTVVGKTKDPVPATVPVLEDARR